jgi:hypothetical protein
MRAALVGRLLPARKASGKQSVSALPMQPRTRLEATAALPHQQR